jgi:hypothetical protein
MANLCSWAFGKESIMGKYRGPGPKRIYTGNLHLSTEGGVVEVKGGLLKVGGKMYCMGQIDANTFIYLDRIPDD